MSHDTGEEAKYHLSYRVTAFLDVLGQGEKLAMLKRMPQTTEEREKTRQLLAETAGYVLQLRRLLKQYFERFRQPSHLIDDLPPDVQEQIRTAFRSSLERFHFSCVEMYPCHEFPFGCCFIQQLENQ